MHHPSEERTTIMSLHTLFRSLFEARKPLAQRHRTALKVERFEDRTVPGTLFSQVESFAWSVADQVEQPSKVGASGGQVGLTTPDRLQSEQVGLTTPDNLPFEQVGVTAPSDLNSEQVGVTAPEDLPTGQVLVTTPDRLSVEEVGLIAVP
jgi:hypothetical protein